MKRRNLRLIATDDDQAGKEAALTRKAMAELGLEYEERDHPRGGLSISFTCVDLSLANVVSVLVRHGLKPVV